LKREVLIIEISGRGIAVYNHGHAGSTEPLITNINEQASTDQQASENNAYNAEAITKALRTLVNTNGLAGATAHCIYDLGDAAISLVSCPASLGLARAHSAAELAAEDKASDAPDTVYTLCDLATDRTNSNNQAATTPSQRHTLIATESDQTLTALRSVIQLSGLRPGWLTPAAAVHAAALARRAMDAQGAGVDVIIGWRTTVLATHRAGRLVSIRTLSAGVETMLKAIDTQDHTENHHETLEQLATATDPTALRTTAGQPIIPKVAPVLQRLGVELKQSLRLGIPDTERRNAVVTVWSSAGRFDWLAGMISTFIEVESRTGPEPISAPSAWRQAGIARLGLLPRAKLAERRGKRILASLWCGAAAACGLLATEAFITRADIHNERGRIAAVAAVRADAERLVAQRDATAEAIERQRRWSTAIDKALGEATDIASVLHTLASATPEPVRFEGLDIERDAQHRIVCRLRGRVVAQGVAAAGALGDFINNARSSPMIADAAIRHVERFTTRETRTEQATTADTASASRFEIELTFVTTPFTVAHKPMHNSASPNIPAIAAQPYNDGD